jgi:hypothetical protein
MKIQLKQEASVGDIRIPAGDYLASCNTETSQIKLVGRGTDYSIPATRRPSKTKSRISSVQFYSMGGPLWTLVVTTPPLGEYFAFLKFEKDSLKKDDEQQ